MKSILVLFAHPNIKKSRANRIILDRIQSLPNVVIDNLYDNYPNFYFDVKKEQSLLAKADLIMFQQPFYWYAMPPLLKAWCDDVLELGYAYGPHGTALKGKDFLLSITAGGPHESYQASGYNNFEITQFLPPYIQTANLCGMKWLDPIILHSAIRANDEQLEAHAEKVRERLVAYSNKNFQIEQDF